MREKDRQVKSRFTWESYRRFVLDNKERYLSKSGSLDVDMAILNEYRSRLPTCLLARCPECGRKIAEPVDTFSLNGFGWRDGGSGRGWSGSLRGLGYCDHVKIVTWFLNLNGLVPDDMFEGKQIRSLGPEVPNLMTIPAMAPHVRIVMQHLPIGRFDDRVWTPQYSLYFLTYFAGDAGAFRRATVDFFPEYSLERWDTERDFDLGRHADEGRLLWMDPDSADRLVGSKDAPFPYRDIQGERSFDFVITREGIQKRQPRCRLLKRALAWITR